MNSCLYYNYYIPRIDQLDIRTVSNELRGQVEATIEGPVSIGNCFITFISWEPRIAKMRVFVNT